jgi:alpha-glucosidase
MGFNFPYLQAPWDAVALRAVIDETITMPAPATWVLGNHDIARPVSRYGRTDTSYYKTRHHHGTPVDLELGNRRARAAALLSFALPGSVFIYQGEELGLWEVEDIPPHLRQDPAFHRSGGMDIGRDGRRVPIPWEGDRPPFAFSPAGATADPWLPQPAAWKDHSVAVQTEDPGSVLRLYRAAMRIRRAEPSFGDGELTWLDAPEQVLAFSRGPGIVCVVNFSPSLIDLPSHSKLLLASGPLDGDRLPPDTTAWLSTT